MSTLGDWLAEERFALAMSSGFFGFFAHAGLLTALEERGLRPSHVCGSSAGALVAGLWAAGLPTEAIADELHRLERAHFWDPGVGLGVLRGERFQAILERLLPVRTFDETRVPLAVSVYDVRARKVRVLRSGPLARAIRASCAVPLLFHPVWIDGRPYVDGGVADRPGCAGLPEKGRVLYHHLTSKSPWRIAVPEPKPNTRLRTIAIASLPRVGPFRLYNGPKAFERARDETHRLLDAP